MATLLIRLTALPGQLRSQAAPFLRPLATQEPAALQADFTFLQKPLQPKDEQLVRRNKIRKTTSAVRWATLTGACNEQPRQVSTRGTKELKATSITTAVKHELGGRKEYPLTIALLCC